MVKLNSLVVLLKSLSFNQAYFLRFRSFFRLLWFSRLFFFDINLHYFTLFYINLHYFFTLFFFYINLYYFLHHSPETVHLLFSDSSNVDIEYSNITILGAGTFIASSNVETVIISNSNYTIISGGNTYFQWIINHVNLILIFQYYGW